MEKNDPMNMFKSAKPPKIVTQEQDKKSHSESDLQSKICIWLKRTYPDLLWLSDYAAGIPLQPFSARLRSVQSCNHKMVDLIILKPMTTKLLSGLPCYHGLCLELKTGHDKVFMQDGIALLKNEHTLSQYQTIKMLRAQGYAACFGCGEIEIKKLVVDYMNCIFVHPVVIER